MKFSWKKPIELLSMSKEAPQVCLMETQAQRNKVSNKPHQASFDAKRSSTSLQVRNIAEKLMLNFYWHWKKNGRKRLKKKLIELLSTSRKEQWEKNEKKIFQAFLSVERSSISFFSRIFFWKKKVWKKKEMEKRGWKNVAKKTSGASFKLLLMLKKTQRVFSLQMMRSSYLFNKVMPFGIKSCESWKKFQLWHLLSLFRFKNLLTLGVRCHLIFLQWIPL